jgi:hypothetical protein
MKKINVKAILPHVIAIGIFLIISLIYCKPALEGKVLQQHDISEWKGAIHNSEEYAARHNGKYPLWTNGLFSGMPAIQIGGIGGNYISGIVHTALTLNLPKPINFFFLACICFYILCITLKLNPYASIMGSLAFAFATYNPVIISVGHDTKMLSIAYMPALLSGILLIYEKKYWSGALLTALFSSAMISMNHLQIAYYLFIAIGIATIFYIVQWIKAKEFKHLFISGALAIVATAAGILTNAEMLMGTYEYQKETIRGGGSVLTDTASAKTAKSTTGLDKDYALSYSMAKTEPLVMMFPKMFGGSSGKEEVKQENSKAIEAISAMPRELQNQMPLSYYWGGIADGSGNAGTAGPPYVGAIVCFLALLSFFAKDNKHRWWIITAVGITILMSWGSYFDSFNSFLYNNLPFYNKFRAPSMIMAVSQLLLPFAAVIFINFLIITTDKKTLIPLFKKGAIAAGAIFTLMFLFYFSFDFTSIGDKNMLKQVKEMNQPQLMEYVKSFFGGLKEDRQSLMMSSILRTLGFIVLAAGALFLYFKNIIKPVVLSFALALIAFLDVVLVNNLYLNAENYQEKEENAAIFTPSQADQSILSDKSDYRVFNVSGSAFQENMTSYFYKSVGGYHPAKLRIYQDLIEKQLGRREINFSVLNMLNTKYLIEKDRAGVTQKMQKNEAALGPCWLVKQIVFVKNADEEMKALDSFNPKDTAFVQETFKTQVSFLPQPDTAAYVRLVKNDNDIITYDFNSFTNQFAVFSEIYYAAGWKAFIDGKETPIIKTNYVLRGLPVTAGKHSIEFRFEPPGLLMGKKVSMGAVAVCIILLLIWLAAIFKNKQPATA